MLRGKGLMRVLGCSDCSSPCSFSVQEVAL